MLFRVLNRTITDMCSRTVTPPGSAFIVRSDSPYKRSPEDTPEELTACKQCSAHDTDAAGGEHGQGYSGVDVRVTQSTNTVENRCVCQPKRKSHLHDGDTHKGIVMTSSVNVPLMTSSIEIIYSFRPTDIHLGRNISLPDDIIVNI